MSKKVMVVMGGFSSEQKVSRNSGRDIVEALKSKGYEVITHDLTDSWAFIEALKKEKPEVVFNGLYGNWGEDGEIQGVLDFLQIPYTHSGLKASALGMDKFLTKYIARENGIKVAECEKMTARDYFEYGTKINFPYVVKPVCDGSSVGVFIVHNEEDKAKVFYKDLDEEVLVEEFIPGHELTVMVLNGKAHVVTELKAKVEFYNYKAKYTDGVTEHILPAEIPETAAKTCMAYAEKLHRKIGCRNLSRVDFRYNEKDDVVLLEINTNPGLTTLSLVPEQAGYIGISYADLCEQLVETATCRKIQPLNL